MEKKIEKDIYSTQDRLDYLAHTKQFNSIINLSNVLMSAHDRESKLSKMLLLRVHSRRPLMTGQLQKRCSTVSHLRVVIYNEIVRLEYIPDLVSNKTSHRPVSYQLPVSDRRGSEEKKKWEIIVIGVGEEKN